MGRKSLDMTQKAASQPHTTDADRLAILDWLGNASNFKLIVGSAGRTLIIACLTF